MPTDTQKIVHDGPIDPLMSHLAGKIDRCAVLIKFGVVPTGTKKCVDFQGRYPSLRVMKDGS
ncbi:hypothetical protein DESC_720181 [Desulfosarcina cetonica]|nr:hypothetical protein DESC_720181 [Desulfosarcina cetonica]